MVTLFERDMMTKNGADAKAVRYFELKEQVDALKRELDEAKDELVEVMRERKTPLILENNQEVIVTEYTQKSTKWKALYEDAYDRLEKEDRKAMKRKEKELTSETDRVKISKK